MGLLLLLPGAIGTAIQLLLLLLGETTTAFELLGETTTTSAYKYSGSTSKVV